ncbi:hypothetical protein PR202_gb15824 [Eleusine coracana subsp. coracana]|uniref:Glycine--tRNA ligase n=1 Tax=Eleusine coracana subsp. coracana TaxID=191504 RepID=A0AAV5EWL3_ELECO|nr:hypothetical protein PR202_gb15824 [Eleusine coracana subsp. coracana]
MLLLRRVLLSSSSAPSPSRAQLANQAHRFLHPPETLLSPAARRRLAAMASAAPSMTREAFRAAVNNTLERRLFFVPSFKIYGGVAGLYDYGPPGCAVKANVLAFWRQRSPLHLVSDLSEIPSHGFYCRFMVTRSEAERITPQVEEVSGSSREEGGCQTCRSARPRCYGCAYSANPFNLAVLIYPNSALANHGTKITQRLDTLRVGPTA